jgi:hypothetical protein
MAQAPRLRAHEFCDSKSLTIELKVSDYEKEFPQSDNGRPAARLRGRHNSRSDAPRFSSSTSARTAHRRRRGLLDHLRLRRPPANRANKTRRLHSLREAIGCGSRAGKRRNTATTVGPKNGSWIITITLPSNPNGLPSIAQGKPRKQTLLKGSRLKYRGVSIKRFCRTFRELKYRRPDARQRIPTARNGFFAQYKNCAASSANSYFFSREPSIFSEFLNNLPQCAWISAWPAKSLSSRNAIGFSASFSFESR